MPSITNSDCCQALLLFQLWSGHVGLNLHLFRIRKAESPACLKCQGVTVESVKHFLLDCPHYKNEWHTLQRKLHRNAGSLSFLLSSPVEVMPLLKFVHTTGRFKMFFGKEKSDKIHTNLCRNGKLQLAAEKLESTVRKAVSDKCKQTLAQLQQQAAIHPPLT